LYESPLFKPVNEHAVASGGVTRQYGLHVGVAKIYRSAPDTEFQVKSSCPSLATACRSINEASSPTLNQYEMVPATSVALNHPLPLKVEDVSAPPATIAPQFGELIVPPSLHMYSQLIALMVSDPLGGTNTSCTKSEESDGPFGSTAQSTFSVVACATGAVNITEPPNVRRLARTNFLSISKY